MQVIDSNLEQSDPQRFSFEICHRNYMAIAWYEYIQSYPNS